MPDEITHDNNVTIRSIVIWLFISLLTGSIGVAVIIFMTYSNAQSNGKIINDIALELSKNRTVVHSDTSQLEKRIDKLQKELQNKATQPTPVYDEKFVEIDKRLTQISQQIEKMTKNIEQLAKQEEFDIFRENIAKMFQQTKKDIEITGKASEKQAIDFLNIYKKDIQKRCDDIRKEWYELATELKKKVSTVARTEGIILDPPKTK